VWAVAGFIGSSTVVSAQHVNPFAVEQTPVSSWQSQSLGPLPVAQARLQLPQVSQTARSSVAMPSTSVPGKTHPLTSSVGYPSDVYIGPPPSAFAPQSFGASQQPTLAPTPAAARPSRLPVASSDDNAVDDRSDKPSEAPPSFSHSNTRLASAARQRSNFIASTPPTPPSATTVYLASQTAQSQIDAAATLLRQAGLEYECAAYASAETSAWDALEKAATAIDLARAPRGPGAQVTGEANQAGNALRQFYQGKRALIEAQDFVGPFAQGDPQAIARLARAHQTTVVRETLPPMMGSYSAEARVRLGQGRGQQNSNAELPTASEAIDRYLDFARSQFSGIAADSMLAAQTMDLLAAIRLGRNETTQLPGPTAICLRRAAVQGQSTNADLVAKLGHQLADVGLIDEARWALGHSLTLQYNPANAARLASLNATAQQTAKSPYGSSILAATRVPEMQPNQPKRIPEITTLPPDQFAAISHSVIPGSPQSETAPRASHTTPVYQQFASTTARQPVGTESPAAPSSQNFFQAMTASFRTQTPPAENQAVALPAYQTPDSQSSTHQPLNDAGRVSSRFLPAMKKWW
jgi:hypothetical protein